MASGDAAFYYEHQYAIGTDGDVLTIFTVLPTLVDSYARTKTLKLYSKSHADGSQSAVSSILHSWCISIIHCEQSSQ